MLSEIEISQYIATKLCHDLAGTIGAISNGIDFISVENLDMCTKAVDLIKTSAEQSVHRLIFYRQAFGVAKHHGEANLDDLKKTAADYLKDKKVKLNFDEKYFRIPGVYISLNHGKLMLCLIQHANSNLIHGGEIVIKVEKRGGQNLIIISAIGESPKIDNEKNDILNGKHEQYELSTQNCTAFYTLKFAQCLKVKFEINTELTNQVDYTIYF